MSRANGLLDAALSHHALGRPIIPVQRDKTPACDKWGLWRFQAQTEEEVRQLFARPAYGLAVLTWPASDLLVLDYDGPHAEQLWAKKTGITLPPTGQHRTGGGWLHRIFRAPENAPRPERQSVEADLRRKVRIVEEETPCGLYRDKRTGEIKACGVDLLLNGYFIVPPTRGYSEDPDFPSDPGRLAVMPAEVLALARATERKNGKGKAATVTPGSPIAGGQRNDTLTSLAGAMRRHGATEAGIRVALLEDNAARCQPPLPEKEVRDIARSVGKYPPEEKDPDAKPTEEPPPAELQREGLDLVLAWGDDVSFRLAAIRDGRDGIRGELSVIRDQRRLSWGTLPLASTSAREGLRKKLQTVAPGVAWGDRLEEAAWRFTEAARQGEPLVLLTGRPTAPTREVVPHLLYEGEPTLVYGDGDTGKSLFAVALGAAVQSGTPLPFGLRPMRAVTAAYLDWETSRDTLEDRLGKLAAGLGVPPPAILYKRMTRPLVDEAAQLTSEFARRGVGFVVVDSMMFAVAPSDGGFHEPIIAFYNALRLFAPAAVLVLSHVTGEDARRGGAGRPFGGAFAFNGPRLIWEAKRDPDVPDATAIGFTCRKANNLPRMPEPFGLLFKSGPGATTIQPLDLAEASPTVIAGASVTYRLKLALTQAPATVKDLAATLGAKESTVGRLLRRGREKGAFRERTDGRWETVG